MIAARKGTEPGLYAFVAAPQSCGAILFAKANKISLGAQRQYHALRSEAYHKFHAHGAFHPTKNATV